MIDKEFDAFIVDPFVTNSPFDTFLEHESIEVKYSVFKDTSLFIINLA